MISLLITLKRLINCWFSRSVFYLPFWIESFTFSNYRSPTVTTTSLRQESTEPETVGIGGNRGMGMMAKNSTHFLRNTVRFFFKVNSHILNFIYQFSVLLMIVLENCLPDFLVFYKDKLYDLFLLPQQKIETYNKFT